MARRDSSIKARWRSKQRLVLGLMLGLALLAPAHPQDLDKETAGLAERIGRALVAKGKKKVAVTDFVDLQGRPTELGRFLAEQLSVELVNAPGISVMDRANLRSILAEHKLSEEGLVNPETAKRLGQFAGVDVILTGTIVSLDGDVAVTVKAISTETAEIVAASRATFPKTREIQQLLIHGVAGSSSVATAKAISAAADEIAAKDLGDLHVVLKNIGPFRIGNGPDGFRLVFEFTNRNLNAKILFAINGQKQYQYLGGTVMRSQLVDQSGTSWAISGWNGVSVVRGAGRASPAGIAEIIMRGRRLGEDDYPRPGEPAWMGDLTSIPAGETTTVNLSFFSTRQSDHNAAASVTEVEFQGEFVVGMGGDGERYRDFRLYQLTLSNIKTPGRN